MNCPVDGCTHLPPEAQTRRTVKRIQPTELEMLEPLRPSFLDCVREANRAYRIGEHHRGRVLSADCDRLVRRAQLAFREGRAA